MKLSLPIPAVLLLSLLQTTCSKQPDIPKPSTRVQNIILITIDTLRADALSIYGNKLRTNFFETIASQSVVFDRAYTTAPITLPAHTSLLTGLYPPAHGVRNNGTFRASTDLTLLPEIARKHGLSTAAIIGAFPLASQFGLNQGFDIYDDTFLASPESTTFLYAEKNAQRVRERAERWLAGTGSKPFFLWMHFFDPHHPYAVHDRSSNDHPYLQEVLYVDEQLGLFFEFLKSRNLVGTTALFLTSDHGEAFGEHGEVSHSIFLYNTTLHVPLTISAPGMKSQRRSEIVRLIDIYPTVLEMMNWPAGDAVDGRSLMPLLRGQSLSHTDSYAETLAPALDFGWSPLFSIQTEKIKYIDAPKPEFYNLQHDPKENQNLIGTSKVEPWRNRLQAVKQRAAAHNSSSPPLSTEDREKLESLGYISSGNQQVATSEVDPKDRIATARKIADLTMKNLPLKGKAEAYKEVLKTESSNPLLLLRYAEILLKLMRYEEAERTFQKVIELNYPSAAAYNGLASVYFQQKKFSEAQDLLERAVGKKLADGETYHNLAEFYLNRGLQEKAFQYYDESIRFHFPAAYLRKARLLDVLGRSEEALVVLKRAEAANPSSADVHFHSGMIHFRHQKFANAIQDFEQALKKEPAAKWMLFNLGVAYARAGDRHKANESLQSFLREAPSEMKEERAQARRLLEQLQ